MSAVVARMSASVAPDQPAEEDRGLQELGEAGADGTEFVGALRRVNRETAWSHGLSTRHPNTVKHEHEPPTRKER
ncbi:MAG: hypothetical protein U0821_04810 [Chloroflexota bacterium]